MKSIEIVQNFITDVIPLKTKILTKFQVCVLSCSHFTSISIISHLYNVLTVKSSFCEHCPSNKRHRFKSYVSKWCSHEIWPKCVKYRNMKSKKNMSPKIFSSISYWRSPIIGRIRQKYFLLLIKASIHYNRKQKKEMSGHFKYVKINSTTVFYEFTAICDRNPSDIYHFSLLYRA